MSYLSAEKQSLYSTAPADWVTICQESNKFANQMKFTPKEIDIKE